MKWPWTHAPDPRWQPDFDTLARYNAEVSRGIRHTDEWRRRMSTIQRAFDEAYGRT